MATNIIPQDHVESILSLSTDAYGLSNLMLWISEARNLIDKVRDVVAIDPDVKKRLKDYDVRFNAAEWDSDTGTGMDILILKHRSLIRRMANAAERLEAVHD